MSESLIFLLIDGLVNFATDWLLPVMGIVFIVAMFLRLLIYFTMWSESTFTKEFEKRVHLYLAGEARDQLGGEFHQLTENVLNKTYYETFELKQKFRRRKFDHITCFSDRVFLIQEGAARLVRDTLSQTKYLNKSHATPKFINISKFVFGSNPVFNRVLGLFPMSLFIDVLAILPGLFVIGGIFGTFLGVMKALPELSGMDITDVASTKAVMDAFLLRISFSMSTSIVGILFSVAMTVANAIFSVEDLYIGLVNRYTSSLEFLWNDADDRRKFNAMDAAASTDRRNFRLNVGMFQDNVANPTAKSTVGEGMRASASFPGVAKRDSKKDIVITSKNTEKAAKNAKPLDARNKIEQKATDQAKQNAKASTPKVEKPSSQPNQKVVAKSTEQAKPEPQKAAPATATATQPKPEVAEDSTPQWKGAVNKELAKVEEKNRGRQVEAIIPDGNLEAIEKEINRIYQQRKEGEITKEQWLEEHEKLTQEKEEAIRKRSAA